MSDIKPNQYQRVELIRLVTASWNRPVMRERERKKTSCWNRRGKELEDREEVRPGENSLLKKANLKYCIKNKKTPKAGLDYCFHFVVVLFFVSHVSCTRILFFLISPLDSVLTQVWPKTPVVNISVYTPFETRPPPLPSQIACLLSTLSRLYARMTLWLSTWPGG